MPKKIINRNLLLQNLEIKSVLCILSFCFIFRPVLEVDILFSQFENEGKNTISKNY